VLSVVYEDAWFLEALGAPLTGPGLYVKGSCGLRRKRAKTMAKNSKLFDIIVLAGMVVNIILAVFLILYYFDFL
jgi:hypothetical protein